ncbi:MAG: class I SAM-dependent methyltransferase [Chthoniobacterales bacterium]
MQGYVRGKIRTDPAYHIALSTLRNSHLPVLDIGCGMGFLSFFLRECGFAPPIIGVDFDAPKIASAREIAHAHYEDLDFRVEDAASVQDFQGNVVLLDVLQYLPPEKQHDLLRLLPSLIAPGGQCIIRGTPKDSSWRFRFTQWDDRAMHAIRWIKSPALYYLSKDEITGPFLLPGFRSEVRPLWGRTPFNSHLFVFERTTESVSCV